MRDQFLPGEPERIEEGSHGCLAIAPSSLMFALIVATGRSTGQRVFPDHCRGVSRFFQASGDATLSQALPMRYGTVASVAPNNLRLMKGTPSLASDVRNYLIQSIKLGDVVSVCCVQDTHERNALRLDDGGRCRACAGPWDSGRFFPAIMARIDELSPNARDKSISPRRRPKKR